MAAPRIAYLTHYAEPYGANRSLLELMQELRSLGEADPVVVIPREGRFTELVRARGFEVVVAPFEPWMSERTLSGRLHHRWMQHRAYGRAARARAAANNALVPDLAGQLRRLGVAMLHANSAAVSIAHRLQQALRIPLVWHVREMPELHYGLHLDSGRKAYGKALLGADGILAISAAVERDVRRYAGAAARITVVPNGILHQARYVDVRVAGAARWSAGTPFTFAQIGLLHRGKGQEEAVEALALVRRTHPEVRLRIAGGGKDIALKAAIQRTGQGDAVDLLGFVDDPFTVLAEAHALLMCSREEAMGRVTVEAFASGIPVIGHASGGTMELIEEGVNGLLYAGGAEALATRMRELVAAPDRARTMGDRASLLAEQRFSIERSTQGVLDVYRSVLSADPDR